MTLALPSVHVGRTQIKISRIGLGTAPLGTYTTTPDARTQAIATIEYALNNGISYIDTAPYYGAGLSERLVSEVVTHIPRTDFVLSTKVGRLITPEGQVIFNFTRDGILRSVEDSLKRLQLDYVDILLVHDPDEHYKEALDDAFPTLIELRSQGMVKAIGAGMNQWQMLADFARHTDPDCFLLAGRYTLLEQGALDEFLPLCQQKGLGLLLGGVFNSGILARGSKAGATYNYATAPQEIVERVRRIEAVCERYQVPLNVAAVQFPLAHPAVTALLLGAEKPEEVATNLQALRTPLPAELWTELRNEGLLHEAAPVPLQPLL
jgi:D-threo-aldose 1-dehydrogenase